ncbi:MAG TPA: glycoside hydrolase family 15 protein, partial [Ktedonobacteraceae bacterium]|nr:glycoside hydrolase family 15 protein [Ktedonobacteraceae bacterium]
AVNTIGGTAPNNDQWTNSSWASSNNSILGTAQNTSSDVWFTGGNGIIGEVFYPTADTPNTTDLQFLVGDSSHTWVNQEQNDTISKVHLYDNHSLAWVVTNTARNGDYQITKIIFADPTRNSLIQQTTFKALQGHLADYQLYVYYNPAIHNKGDNNNSSTKTYQGRVILVSTSGAGKYASALAASLPYQKGMTSSGFLGQSDGWTDLAGKSACGSATCPDYTMNYTYSAAADGNTVQTGLLDLSNGGMLDLSSATSLTFNLVLSFGQSSGGGDATTGAEQALLGSLNDRSNMLSTYVAQWNSFDDSLRAPPAVGSTAAIQQARQQEYYLAANVLKASQDKQSGTFVAGLGTPWGESNGDQDTGGYHLVWERDMYEFSSALIVAGDTADPKRALLWAFTKQQQPGGLFPQNSYVDGTPYFGGVQMDEQAFPIMLAWKLGVTDRQDYLQHIKPAADLLVKSGGITGQERWEENGGYSPSTIATMISGLVSAAAIARINNDVASQQRYLSTADNYRKMVIAWTYTTTGPLGNGHYFERIDGNGNPNDTDMIQLTNGGGTFDERSVVDMGFLELVRQGIYPANSPYITSSLPVVDATLEETINGNSYWHRYNHDGYGEHANGSDYDGTGVGQLWPILSGERGIYEVAAGQNADQYLTAMMAAANASGLIPEQVWGNNAPARYTPGTPTKSMNPLNWAMGEYITLLFSVSEHAIADVVSITAQRYRGL